MDSDLFWVLQEDAVSDDELYLHADMPISVPSNHSIKSQLRACHVQRKRKMRRLLTQQVLQLEQLHQTFGCHTDHSCMPIERSCQFEVQSHDSMMNRAIPDITRVLAYTNAVINGKATEERKQRDFSDVLTKLNASKIEYGHTLETMYANEMERLFCKHMEQREQLLSFYVKEIANIQAKSMAQTHPQTDKKKSNETVSSALSSSTLASTDSTSVASTTATQAMTSAPLIVSTPHAQPQQPTSAVSAASTGGTNTASGTSTISTSTTPPVPRENPRDPRIRNRQQANPSPQHGASGAQPATVADRNLRQTDPNTEVRIPDGSRGIPPVTSASSTKKTLVYRSKSVSKTQSSEKIHYKHMSH